MNMSSAFYALLVIVVLSGCTSSSDNAEPPLQPEPTTLHYLGSMPNLCINDSLSAASDELAFDFELLELAIADKQLPDTLTANHIVLLDFIGQASSMPIPAAAVFQRHLTQWIALLSRHNIKPVLVTPSEFASAMSPQNTLAEYYLQIRLVAIETGTPILDVSLNRHMHGDSIDIGSNACMAVQQESHDLLAGLML